MQIIVLGMHRSGTSLVTRIINMMGAYVGPEGCMLDLTPDNPKGYWERKDVVKYNIFLMKFHGVDWAGYNPASWPLRQQAKEPPLPLRDGIKALVFNMDAHRPWVIKDPRLCITLPCWKAHLEVPVCVIVDRDPLEIAESLHKVRHAREPIPHQRGLALWEFYAVALLNASRDLPRVFASHADFLHDPVDATARLYHALASQEVQGLRLPSKREILAFVDPALYRSKRKTQERRPPDTGGYLPGLSVDGDPFTPQQRELMAMMRGDRHPEADLAVSAESMDLLRQAVDVIHP